MDNAKKTRQGPDCQRHLKAGRSPPMAPFESNVTRSDTVVYVRTPSRMPCRPIKARTGGQGSKQQEEKVA